MDSVPLNVHMQNLSYLSLNEIAERRLVTRSFKQAFDEMLKHISLSDEERWSNSHREKMALSYIRETFFSKPFVEVASLDNSRFFAYLAMFGPNLWVLRIHDHELSCDELFLLPPRLEFIACGKLPFRTRESAQQVQPLCAHLPNLQGFISDEPLSWVLKNPIRQIWNYEVHEEILQLFARGGKYLHMCKEERVLPSFCISQPLAGSLVGLSLDFFRTGKHCSFSLPNLLCLEAAGHLKRPGIAKIESFLPTSNSTELNFQGEITPEDFCRLMNNIHSLDKLIILMLDFSFIEDASSNIPLISLPQNLNTLLVKTNGLFRFFDGSSLSLKQLFVHDTSELRFNFPNLELLSCETQLSPQLLESLSKCGKLRKVQFKLRTTENSVSLQPLVDLLCSMNHLQDLSLSCSSKTPTIQLELREDHSLTDLRFKLPKTKLIFHLFGSFRLLQLRRPDIASAHLLHFTQIRLKGPRKELKVLGFGLGSVTIMFHQ